MPEFIANKVQIPLAAERMGHQLEEQAVVRTGLAAGKERVLQSQRTRIILWSAMPRSMMAVFSVRTDMLVYI